MGLLTIFLRSKPLPESDWLIQERGSKVKRFQDIICDLGLNEIDPLKNLTLQDSLIVVAVYVNRMLLDLGKDKDGIHRIEKLARENSLFIESSEVTLSRIYKYTNLMKTRDRCTAVVSAAKSLTPRLRNTAFEWAVNLVLDNGILRQEEQSILDSLSELLSIDHKATQEIITKVTSSRKILKD
jgi:hypothetical protein